MNKSAEIKRNTIGLIAKNLIILVVLAVVAFVGAFSWFTQNTTAIADGIYAKTKVSDGLEYFIVAPSDKTLSTGYADINTWISTYNSTHGNETGFVAKKWHIGEVTLDTEDAEFGFLSNLFLCETTSDGYTFKVPKLVQYGEIAYVDTNEPFEDAVANEQYLSFDIYFRSKTENDVKLLHNSTLAPIAAPATTNEEAMKNAAIGAVRLSVYNGSHRELLWIPGPNVWFNGAANNGVGELNVNQTTYPANRGNVYISGTSYELYSERTIDHAYYNASALRDILENTPLNNNTSNVVASTAGDYQLGSSESNDIPVCTLDSTNYDSTNGYYYNRIRVNLWIEGEDAEARLKFVSGKFNLSLLFDAAE